MNNPGLGNDQYWGQAAGGQHTPPICLPQSKTLHLKLLKPQTRRTKGKASAHVVKPELAADTKLVFLGVNLQQCHGTSL